MNRINWRWSEKDYGFRFRSGAGKSKAEYYQASEPGMYYAVPLKQRKLTKERIEELAPSSPPPSPQVVPSPWRNYEQEWDWIMTGDGILMNYAGCLDREEIERREDEGVARAMELVAEFLERAKPVAVTSKLICQIHVELMGAIYPFAGAWRNVDLHKGGGSTKWPLPPGGIGLQMDMLERDIFSRSPFLSEDDHAVFEYVAEVMGEMLVLHPFREGNGRTAFIVGNLLLMQNDRFLPLDVYDRKQDQERYFAACEIVRIKKTYAPLVALIDEWQQAALARWEAAHGE